MIHGVLEWRLRSDASPERLTKHRKREPRMADGTTTSTAQMATFQNQASEAASRLTSMLTTLVQQLQPLQENWRGAGGTSFQTTTATVQTETSKLNNALTGIATAVGTAGTNYANADSEQQTQMNNVNSATTGITSALQA